MARVLFIGASSERSGRFRERLESDGHWVLTIDSIDTVAQKALSHRPDIIVTDDDADAITALEMLQRFPFAETMPVVSTNQGLKEDAVAQAERLAAVIRSTLENPSTRRARRFLKVGPLELDRHHRSVRLGVSIVTNVPPRAFELLWLLAKRSASSRSICPRRHLISKLWKHRVRDRQVDVTMSRLRAHVPFLENYLETVSSGGYRLIPPNPSPHPASPSARRRGATPTP